MENYNPHNVEFAVEAVSIRHGENSNKIDFKILRNSKTANRTEEKPMQLRLLQSISKKCEQYDKWIKNKIIEKTTPLIIAISLGCIELGPFYPNTAIKETFLKTDPTDQEGTITKKNGAKVRIGIFSLKENEFISAIIISKRMGIKFIDILNADKLNNPMQSKDFLPLLNNDLVLLHNPNALNRLPKNILNLPLA